MEWIIWHKQEIYSCVAKGGISGGSSTFLEQFSVHNYYHQKLKSPPSECFVSVSMHK